MRTLRFAPGDVETVRHQPTRVSGPEGRGSVPRGAVTPQRATMMGLVRGHCVLGAWYQFRSWWWSSPRCSGGFHRTELPRVQPHAGKDGSLSSNEAPTPYFSQGGYAAQPWALVRALLSSLLLPHSDHHDIGDGAAGGGCLAGGSGWFGRRVLALAFWAGAAGWFDEGAGVLGRHDPLVPIRRWHVGGIRAPHRRWVAVHHRRRRGAHGHGPAVGRHGLLLVGLEWWGLVAALAVLEGEELGGGRRLGPLLAVHEHLARLALVPREVGVGPEHRTTAGALECPRGGWAAALTLPTRL